MRQGNFLINGKNGMDDLNSWIETYPTISIPKRKKTFQQIEGSNYQAILDENAYDNREIDLSIVVRAEDEVDRTMRLSALASAFDSPGYIDFTYYGEPNINYRITNAETISVKRISSNMFWSEVSLKLSAEAFKYYAPEQSIDLSGSITLTNKFLFPSRPLIKTSSNDFKINGNEYKFNSDGVINIDCDVEQQDVYNDSGLIENAFDMNQEFPSLLPGDNTIEISNGTLWPRWRTI